MAQDQPQESASKSTRRPGLRILLSAFACNPHSGSEQYVGWRWLLLLSQISERLVVLTREYNRPLLADQKIPENVEFIFLDLPFGGKKLSHFHPIIKPYYSIWQLVALLRVAFSSRIGGVGFIQHVTYAVIDMPGFLWLLRGRKFVWGPVGGGQVPPKALKRAFASTDWARERVRIAMKSFLRWNPLVLAAARRADLVLFANEETAARLKGLTRRSELMAVSALEIEQINANKRAPAENEVFELLWLSRFDRKKAFPIAVDAMRLAIERCDRPIKLDVVGGGPTFARAKALVSASGMEEHIRLLGPVPFPEVAEKMERAAAFLFTSACDTLGIVLLEAMAAGTPVIALNHQGARMVLNKGGGILVDIGTYDETVSRYADAIVALATNRELWLRSSAQAIERIKTDLNWDAYAVRMAKLYDELLGTAHRA